MQACLKSATSCCPSFSAIISDDICYAVAWAVSTAAITAFSFYAPVTFFLGSTILSTLNVFYLTRAISNGIHSQKDKIKNWMIVSCFVMSAVLGGALLRLSPLVQISFTLVKTFKKVDFLLFNLFILNGVIGYAAPALKALYTRGLELLKTARWDQMERYLKHNKERRPRIDSIPETLSFFATVVSPQDRALIFNRFGPLAFIFLSEEQKKKKLTETISDFEQNLAYVTLDTIQIASKAVDNLLEISNFLPPDEKIPIFSQLLSSVHRHPTLQNRVVHFLCQFHKSFTSVDYTPLYPNLSILPPNCFGIITNQTPNLAFILDGFKKEKIETISKEYATIFHNFTTMEESFKIRLEAQRIEKNQTELEAISKAISEVRNIMGNLSRDCEAFLPDQKENITFLRETQIKLNALVVSLESIKGENDAIDRTDDTWYYFVVNNHFFFLEDFINGLYDYFFSKFNLPTMDKLKDTERAQNNARLVEILENLQIGTIGEFITHVLNGNDQLLKGQTTAKRDENSKEIRRLFDAYVASRAVVGSRTSLYSFLAGGIKTHGSKWTNLASKIAYRAIMILSSMAVMVVYQKWASAGFTISFICNTISPLRELIAECFAANAFSHSGDWLGLSVLAYNFASERPFLSLFSRQSPPEMRSFEQANLFGRARILSLESLYGWLLFVFNPRNMEGLGGFVQGLALGTELHRFTSYYATKAWRHITGRITY